jgi:hypothetical protein
LRLDLSGILHKISWVSVYASVICPIYLYARNASCRRTHSDYSRPILVTSSSGDGAGIDRTNA